MQNLRDNFISAGGEFYNKPYFPSYLGEINVYKSVMYWKQS